MKQTHYSLPAFALLGLALGVLFAVATEVYYKHKDGSRYVSPYVVSK